jgi:hypothetical protein
VRSGRLMLQLISEHVARGESFAFEATLAGRNYARSIPHWRAQGYRIADRFVCCMSAYVSSDLRGYGLSGSGAVEAQGGNVWAESSAGGARFTFTLPLAR